MKTKEELNALKTEVEAMNKKLAELTEDELAQVTGGWKWGGFEVFLSGSSEWSETIELLGGGEHQRCP